MVLNDEEDEDPTTIDGLEATEVVEPNSSSWTVSEFCGGVNFTEDYETARDSWGAIGGDSHQ